MKSNRRQLLKTAGGVALGLPLVAREIQGQSSASLPEPAPLRVMVAGAHPDDPETGCGGTMALYSRLGHHVSALYLTRGEAGIPGTSHQESADIRTREAEAACRILKARPVFAGQVDGDSLLTKDWYRLFGEVMDREKPDLVFTHWPLDSHRDHRVTSMLVYDYWIRKGRPFALFFYEVLSGDQTSHFAPTHYVDISEVEQLKKSACYAHMSQRPDAFYPHHDAMNRFRGLECGCRFAEAFIRHQQNRETQLPLVR